MNQGSPMKAAGVGFSYGQRAILSNINLQAEVREIVGLIGPNGAGKTTFLRIVSGTLTPQTGNVYIQGIDLPKLPPKNRARLVAMVRQNPAVPPGFTALEVVLMGRNPYLGLLQWEGPRDLDVCRRVMELTQTWEFADRQVSSLSGGEIQRVFIARALAQETPLLVLDEPTAHLDISYQTGILDMIQIVCRQTGITVLLAMHDLTLAAQYCTRIAALHEGSIYAVGEPAEVLTADIVSTVFAAPVSIIQHPVHKTPVVLPVGQEVSGDETINRDEHTGPAPGS